MEPETVWEVVNGDAQLHFSGSRMEILAVLREEARGSPSVACES